MSNPGSTAPACSRGCLVFRPCAAMLSQAEGLLFVDRTAVTAIHITPPPDSLPTARRALFIPSLSVGCSRYRLPGECELDPREADVTARWLRCRAWRGGGSGRKNTADGLFKASTSLLNLPFVWRASLRPANSTACRRFVLVVGVYRKHKILSLRPLQTRRCDRSILSGPSPVGRGPRPAWIRRAALSRATGVGLGLDDSAAVSLHRLR